MHLLIGLSILVGLIAFAFGGDVARALVRLFMISAAILLLAAMTYLAVDIAREFKSTEAAPQPPKFLYACAQYLKKPDDPPCTGITEWR
jgi:hypothetical protein